MAGLGELASAGGRGFDEAVFVEGAEDADEGTGSGRGPQQEGGEAEAGALGGGGAQGRGDVGALGAGVGHEGGRGIVRRRRGSARQEAHAHGAHAGWGRGEEGYEEQGARVFAHAE